MIPSTTCSTAWWKPTTAAARITITHDERGNRITIRSANAVLADTQNVTRFTYDKLNRLTAERDPLGYGLDYGYNVLGERTSQTTALGTQTGLPTNFLYDALGRLETIDYPQGEGEANIDTHFSYGPTDLRMSMTDGVGATTWTYTALGLVKSVEDPSQNVVEYGYDGLGNRARLIYPDQKTVTYGYDKLNRLETITDWNNQITSYTYLSTQTGFTRQVHRPNGVVSTETLDPVGRLVDRVHANESTTLASYHYEYEPAGNRWQATERMLGYSHFLPVILNPESGGEKTIGGMEKAYPAPSEGEPLPLEKGAPKENAYPAPETTKQSSSLLDALVDFFTWLLSPQDTVQAAAPAQAVPLPLQEDAPLGSYFLTDPVEITYLYDNLHRLTNATDNIGNTYAYAYDANGNRVSEQAPGGSPVISVYDQANRLTNVGGAPYAWDANGNLTNDGTRQYIYTNNKLSSITDAQNNELISYQYNGLGNRVSQTANGVTTSYVLDQAAELAQVLSDGTNTYLYGNERIAQYNGDNLAYFLTDALGSVRQLIDGSGIVTMAKNYQPYGEVMTNLSNGASMYGFTGELTDPMGLIYLRARTYSPILGRFLSRDTWQGDYTRPLSLNLWNYVEGNPINRVDPTGHDYSYGQLSPDKRDLTDWLPRAAVYISTDPAMLEVKRLLSSDVLGNKLDAYYKFNNLVKDGAQFDVKDKIEEQLGHVVKLGDDWFEWSVTGNILYGFYGSAAGFRSDILHYGAGYAQFNDWRRWIWSDGCPDNYPGIGGQGHYFDTPDDYHAVDFGIWLFWKYFEPSGTFTVYNFLEGLDTFDYSWALNREKDPGDYFPATKTYAPSEFDH